MKQEHPHAWFLRALADGEPLSNFEVRYTEGDGSFSSMPSSRITAFLFAPEEYEFRRKPRTIMIGSVEVVAGITETPPNETIAWLADPTSSDFVCPLRWSNDEYEIRLLQRGLVHLSEENAVVMGKAIAALTEHKT